jgi:large subunit ribosomal protein L54
MATLLRQSSRGLFSQFLRGPKKTATPTGAKKSKGKSVGSESDNFGDQEGSHIFNIFAGVSDPQLEPDNSYPQWLWKLSELPKSYSELSSMFIYGSNIEEATENDYRRFLRQHRKLVIKVNNSRLKKSKSPCENKLRFP